MPERGNDWDRRFHRLPTWVHALLVAGLLAASWVSVYVAGGTTTAWPHSFYVPIVVAALRFGVGGGIAAGLAATVLCGPVMPLDVATGEHQEAANWLLRGGFFVAVGGAAGLSTRSLRRSFEAGLDDQLQAELERATTATRGGEGGTGWEPRIRRLLDRGDFHVVFQPVYALDDGQLLAVEALTRFDTAPPVSPEVWFTEAAAVGLGAELELATAAAALEAAADLDVWVAVAINASPELLCDARLAHLLDRYRDRRVIVEVTEHAVVDDYQQLTDALTGLRERGVRIAVDDAGAGFASFRHIVRLRPEFIKLDPSLTQDLRSDPVRRSLAEALLRFAHQTDSRVIVEGVETAADLVTWQDLGAHAAQGYLLGRPGPLSAAQAAPVVDLVRQAGRRGAVARLRARSAGPDSLR